MKYLINLSLLFRNANFARLYLGSSISLLGMMISSVAIPYQIYHETHSTVMVGLVSLGQLIPLLFTALIGGTLADRYNRKKLLVIAETIMAVSVLLLAFNAHMAHPNIALIFILAALTSALNGLHRPAFSGLTQQIVAAEDFLAMGALNTFIMSIVMIGGPAIGGLIIAQFGLMSAYLADFFSFLISIMAVIALKNIPPLAKVQHESPWLALKSGLRYAKSRQELMGSYWVDFIAMVFGMPNALFPAIAQHYGGVKTLGLLYSAPAVGALVISLFSGWTHHVKQYGKAIAISAMFWGLTIIGFGLSHHLWLALFFLALSGVFDSISGIFRGVLWNQTIPPELRGRLAGIEMISYLSGPRLGDTQIGLSASIFGITISLVAGGVLCAAGVAVCCYLLPKFWRYKE